MAILYPERVHLANLPTPLQHLQRMSTALGVDIYVKRDDLTGLELCGNKVRKLEHLVADAIAHGADTLITCGGEQSNHCRATAFAGIRFGLRSVLLLRTDDPARPPALGGNILLDRLAGAEIRWISPEEYGKRNELMAAAADELRQAGHTPYVIPEGGSNALGAWGYVRASEELAHDLRKLPPAPTTIVYAAGSGGTGAGLILGTRMTGLADRGVHVAGVNVCDNREYFVEVIGRICAEFAKAWPDPSPVIADCEIDIIDGYVGRGYAKSTAEEVEVLRDLARREGLVLDPVYTGKAFYGLTRELAHDRRQFGERIVFLHSGGIFGLFDIDKAEQLEPIL